jgi:integrase
MPKSNTSTQSRKSPKVEKPFPGFPLTPHPSGRWCKKIRGKLHYFGKIDNPNGALEKFNKEWPYLSEGRTPPPVDTGDGCTIRLLANAFLTSKKAALECEDIGARTFADYFATCELLVDHFGKDRRVDDIRPDEFRDLKVKLAKRWGKVRQLNENNRIRTVFNYAFTSTLIDKPMRFGPDFDPPKAKALRKVRREQGPKRFSADEAKRILAAADPQLKAMTLLALNGGFGNTDCASLPLTALDLDGGWLDFPRPKTEIDRRIPLWPETVQALREVIADRPAAKSHEDDKLVFLTRTGQRWVRSKMNKKGAKMVFLDAISQAFAKLLKSIDINSHRNFYTCRHTFETEAGACKDQVAVDFVMGHLDATMAARYREGIGDDRLLAAVNTVHAWLWPPAA